MNRPFLFIYIVAFLFSNFLGIFYNANFFLLSSIFFVFFLISSFNFFDKKLDLIIKNIKDKEIINEKKDELDITPADKHPIIVSAKKRLKGL